METFVALIDRMDNSYVALHHFGEPTLNPLLPDMIAYANKAGKRVEFSTNGVGIHSSVSGSDFLERLMNARPYRIRIAYDFFRPDDFIRSVLSLNRDTIVTVHAVTPGLLPVHKPLNNWAGQMPDLGPSEISGECYFLKYNYFAALSNGDIVPCCQDYEGKHVIGNVHSEQPVLHAPSYELCKTCSGMQFARDGGWWEEVVNADPSLADHASEVSPTRRTIPIRRAK